MAGGRWRLCSAAAPLPVLALHIVVVSRLRKDACPYDLPEPPDPHQRGRHPIYGKNKIRVAKRAVHRQGWQTITYNCRGVQVTRQYKTFLATSELVSGQIRVVLCALRTAIGRLTSTWSRWPKCAYLEAVGARWAIEEHFHDVKEVAW